MIACFTDIISVTLIVLSCPQDKSLSGIPTGAIVISRRGNLSNSTMMSVHPRLPVDIRNFTREATPIYRLEDQADYKL